ncbi:type II toxin-antitoxin system RelE/ParE family toxin [Caballeronia humi]|uniref:Translation repressor RelE n=1 Tax=Caballeronia humi TaxID=326474 RepID=A0A158JFN6_9BURK|nr:type II toxin-antitoxin system RelE/ParE family toxin [Caballeronia humi]SAL67676.1 translation repressor RelE [Caballeronia humi]
MTREIHWSRSARSDIKAIVRYIALYNPPAAVGLRKEIEDAAGRAAETLTEFKEGRIPGTYEVVVTRNYVLVFRTTPERLYVVNVIHTRQQYP